MLVLMLIFQARTVDSESVGRTQVDSIISILWRKNKMMGPSFIYVNEVITRVTGVSK